MHSGVFYCYGRDHDYAPNLYVHPEKIDLNEVHFIFKLVHHPGLFSFLTEISNANRRSHAG